MTSRLSTYRSLCLLMLIVVIAATGCASSGARPSREPGDFGVLVMAHGGKDEWNHAVLDSVEPLESEYPVEVAFGMASAETLQEATRKLEERGVSRIGVVRVFVSGESWYERTRQILGLETGAPSRDQAPAGHHGHHDLMATFWRIDTDSAFALSTDGLMQAEEMGQVLLSRAKDLSVHPERESVLILAHGPGDDDENERWLASLERLAAPLRDEPFRAVRVHTLREDWEDKRKPAEAEIRAFVEAAANDGGRCLVIPFRVFGFGPYAEVLEGLDYTSDGRGLLPHEAVPRWILRQAEALSKGPFEATTAR